MTGWSADPDDLWRSARSLDAAAWDTAVVVARLATAWADATGREWAERLRLAARELDAAARAAADLAARADAGPARDELRTDEPTGVVLGAQTGARTTGRRGVVVPTLPAPP